MLRKYPNLTLISSVVTLTTIGIIMMMSVDIATFDYRVSFKDMYWFHQSLRVAIGVLCAIVIFYIPIVVWHRLVYIFLTLGFCLLGLTLVSEYGFQAGGALRWINLGFIRFQPSEIAKFSMVIYTAYYLSSKKRYLHQMRSLMPFAVTAMAILAMVGMAPDFSGLMVIALIVFLMCYASNIPKIYLLSSIAIGIPAVIYVMLAAEYRLSRLLAFLNPWLDPLGYGYQNIQSLIAFARGGIWGQGYTKSLQKHFYLPESHTDFIFAIIGEEFGLFGTLLTLFLFLVVALSGLSIALSAKDAFHSLLAVGLTGLIVTPAFLHILVAVGVLPITGLPLTFISFGGTSFLVSVTSVSILCRIWEERIDST